ncbi:Aspergillopepsin-2 [Escovopsis weberi]|uniref:Aspergillopepsin-2 n=1 Tax=Escovopsis weberi TaxID=150374 RepID=A0A0M8NA79_ESCWE|nr:Aspergillopepsin-2 [Escovopsis weberi]
MKFSLVLAAAAGLAAASPANLARRQGRRSTRSTPANREVTHPEYSTNWAGAVLEGRGWTSVSGTIVVPRATGGVNAAASAWVGIDGDSCQSAILQTGVDFYGDGSYDAWYEWFPDYAYNFPSFPIRQGDEIKMVVNATSRTSGVAILQNLSTGASVSHSFSGRAVQGSLCQTDAEWIVEDFESGGSLVQFANFGSVTFTGASATGSSGTVTPAGSDILDIRTSAGQVLTDCSASGSTVSCRYI